jgi:hypothetical protein
MQSVPSSRDTLSPAEKKINRRFRSKMPTLNPFFNPIMQKIIQLLVDNNVRIRNAISKRWDDKGTISKIRDSGRSYFVDRDIGRDAILCNDFF